MNHAIVIGASSGMGREVARRLLRDGWTVALAARRREPLEALAAEAEGRAIVCPLDVTHDDADVLLNQICERLGTVDLYFHASGIGKVNHTLQADIELNTVATNALGWTRMVGVAYRWMAEHGGGHIAVISSIAGVRGLGPAPSYSATKAFQHNYIQALEQQANARGLPIVFTELRPGFVDTPLLQGSHFPMTMPANLVVDEIMWAVETHRHSRIIDWKYRVLVALWHLVPSPIWRHMRLGIAKKHS